ncbi:hypothetical protein [Anaerovorax odorimutans]|uniref:hypothetical protein n=1 Tax=Anaerovorax odorimutans TaxID=109327 RepID=UPI000421FB9A|nr:hypothetical protein [Anaerovorax odorimutans]
MEKKPVDWKKFIIVFTGILLICLVTVCYAHFRTPKPDQIIMWSTEGDYCFAVDAPFEGDTFKPGIYHFYNKRLSDLRKVAAWEIYASKTPRNNRSELKEDESVAIVGGAEDLEYTVDISSGNYIYVKYRGDKELTDANSLTVDWTPSPN